MMQAPKLSTNNITYLLNPPNPPPKVKNFASFSNASAAFPFSLQHRRTARLGFATFSNACAVEPWNLRNFLGHLLATKLAYHIQFNI